MKSAETSNELERNNAFAIFKKGKKTMKQSILTKYISPSNTRGARIKAVQSGWNEKKECKSIIISYPYELNDEAAHKLAACKLLDSLGWEGRIIPASLGAWSEFSYCFAIEDCDAFQYGGE